MNRFVFFLLVFSIGLTTSRLMAGEISPYLQQKMLEAMEGNQQVPAVIVLKDQVDIQALDRKLYRDKASAQQRAYTVITALQEKARTTQSALLDYLASQTRDEVGKYQSLWIINCILIEARPVILTEISQRGDVTYLDYEYEAVMDPVFDERPAPDRNINSVEPGLRVVNAHKMWELGFTGAGRLVMNIDTGVDGNHPALGPRWRGTHVPSNQAWYGPGTFPNDNDSHGTHTMGTITGLDPATGDTVGVAPAAEWIAAGTLGTGYSSSYAFQWALNPDGNASTTDDMPDVISNSWGLQNSAGGCYTSTYAPLLNSVEAAGIAVVFSAGNEGPNPQTITGPKNINTNLVNVFATGNIGGTSSNLPISPSSSRGPSGCGGTGSLLIKPEAVAPGTSVRSTVPGGTYGSKSGTSMACPHVAGAIALLKEAFPEKTGHELKLALYYTARETPADLAANDPGEAPGETSGEDHSYGKGVIDVYAAYLYLLFGPAPFAPGNFAAYSDYSMPSTMQLTWSDPTQVINGDPLSPGDFYVVILRDSVVIDSVTGGSEQYLDTGLNDGQEYRYSIYAVMDSSGAASINVETSWIAGGSPIPSAPTALDIYGIPAEIKLKWTNPAVNFDGTPMDDFAGVHLYQDSVMVAFFPRAAADTGRVDSAMFSPSTAGYYYWFITAVDNEIPLNASGSSESVRTPISVTFSDDFREFGEPDPIFWYHEKSAINDDAVNPPSLPHALNLNGTGIPIGDDLIQSYPIDISTESGNNLKFSYFYQTQGIGDPPLSSDSLRIHFKAGNGEWIKIKAYGGEPLTPFRQEIFDMDSLAGVNDFFHNRFQIRISVEGRSHAVLRRADWFIDNIYLGVPSPLVSASTNEIVFDSTAVNDSAEVVLYVNNTGLENLTILQIVSDNFAFLVDTTTFEVASGSNQPVMVTYSPTQVGDHTGHLSIISNAANQDTLRVSLVGVGIPSTGIFDSGLLPRQYSLSQNYPNPFNPVTWIHYELPVSGEVRLEIYNILGQRVRSLVRGWQAAGRYDVEWRGENDGGLPQGSGIYIYRFRSGDYNRTLKMMLMK